MKGEYRNTFSKLLNELIEYSPSEKGKRKIEDDDSFPSKKLRATNELIEYSPSEKGKRKIEDDDSFPSKKLRATKAYNLTNSQIGVI